MCYSRFCLCVARVCRLFSEFAFSALVAVDAERALYTELWKACAGPLVTVPRENELVFYFPQGHIEQVFSLLFCFHFLGGNWLVSRALVDLI